MYADKTSGKTYDMGTEVKKKKPLKNNDPKTKKLKLFMRTMDFNKLQQLATSLKKSAWELEKYTDMMLEDATSHHSNNFSHTKEKVGDILDSMADDLTSFIDEMYPDG